MRTNFALIATAGFIILAGIALAFSLAWRSADQQRLEEGRRGNCLAIEELKTLQRRALSEQIASSRKLLLQHPRGIGGISPELIQESIARNERARKSLARGDC